MKTLRIQICSMAILALALWGCGETRGRIPLTAGGSGTTVVELESGKEIDFWTDLDVEWEGDSVGLWYEISVTREGRQPVVVTCNPFDVSVKIKSVITNLGGRHTRSYDGKMRCSVDAPWSGRTKVQAKLDIRGTPKLTRADLLIKQ